MGNMETRRPAPDQARLERAERMRQEELKRHVDRVLEIAKDSKMSVDRAITELFREIGYNKYPDKTQQAWRRDISKQIAELTQTNS